ncbi:hypothetical protein SDC9_211352 [bioreactor metagenome]|uniref:Uncharacterized protein n=1 Tax=bioreactor metagenome TaxID=1076179 RepID=A0A645JIT2_9ZZZZ
MAERAVAKADFTSELADRLKERLALNIAHRAANFHNRNVIAVCARLDAVFDVLSHVRYNLYRTAIEFAFALVAEHLCVYFSGCNRIELG